MRHSVGSEYHKQDWSKEEDAVLMGNLGMIVVLTLIAGIFIAAWIL